jgi:hypothetical protein
MPTHIFFDDDCNPIGCTGSDDSNHRSKRVRRKNYVEQLGSDSDSGGSCYSPPNYAKQLDPDDDSGDSGWDGFDSDSEKYAIKNERYAILIFTDCC